MSTFDDTSSDTYVSKSRPPATQRIKQLSDFFKNTFDDIPAFFVRVPGRVNLIGEHIDYCGYPVFPMALEQDMLVAVGNAEDPILSIANLNPKYAQHKCDMTDLSIPIGPPSWYHYVICGVRGALEAVDVDVVRAPRGLRLVVSGTVPPAAGLSSSSALVSAIVLAVSHANKLPLEKQGLATLSARSERFIGTEGGGMDQAIAFLAQKGCAQFIEWDPLRAQAVALPQEAVFVIAHSLHEANKAATQHFNCRVVECKLATKIIAKKSNLQWEDIPKLAQLQQKLDMSLEEMIALTEKTLTETSYDRDSICRTLEITDDALVEKCLTNNTADVKQFKLRQRALHVFQEALRVEKFRQTCLSGDEKRSDNQTASDIINQLGVLMRQSHQSLKELYECSHPGLDDLVDLSWKMGVAARLTGAGWGGCIVAICRKGGEQKYIDMLKEKYYKNHPNLNGRNIENILFCTSPQAGAQVYQDA